MKYIIWLIAVWTFIAVLANSGKNSFRSYSPSVYEGSTYKPSTYSPPNQFSYRGQDKSSKLRFKKTKKQVSKKHSSVSYYGEPNFPNWTNSRQFPVFDPERANNDIKKLMQEMSRQDRNIDNGSQANPWVNSDVEKTIRGYNSIFGNPNSSNVESGSFYSARSSSSSLFSNSPSNVYTSNSSSTGTETYVVNGTEYYKNETYSTTGKPKVKRNMAVRHQFLKRLGYDEVPEGYEVDHRIPLSQGGSDTPDNMQLLTIEQHTAKTASERSNISISGSTPSYYSTQTTSPTTYSLPSTTMPKSNPEIQTGPRGGKFYINSNGNKTYVRHR